MHMEKKTQKNQKPNQSSKQNKTPVSTVGWQMAAMSSIF